VPIADADVGGFVSQLLDTSGFPNLKGAAVTNTASVGGAGVTLALKLLSGQTVTTSPDASQPNTVLLDPVLLWPLSLSIAGWTSYDPNTVPSSCKGA
jgi:ribose transport system substrate-binding protein